MRRIVLVLGFAACTVSPSPPKSEDARAAGGEPSPPGLDDARVAEMELVVAKVEADRLPGIAASMLAELERGRLAPALLQALEASAQVDPVARAQGVAKGLDSPAAAAGWAQVCRPAFAAAMASYGPLEPAERTRRLVTDCDLERSGLLPLEVARVDGGALTVAVVMYGALERLGPLHPLERTLLAALAAPAP